MIELELQITLNQAAESGLPTSGLPVRGWYLPSADLADWMEVLNACCSGSNYRLFVAPTSVSDIRASGLIYLSSGKSSVVRLNARTDAGSVGHGGVSHSGECRHGDVPLGAIGLVGVRSPSEHVEIWLPSNARLEPALSLNQLAEELDGSEPRTYVWLPSVGLTAFEPTDAIDVPQLLRRPIAADNANARTWTALPDVEQLPDRIVEIVFPEPEPFEQMFQQEQDEISDESDQLSKIDDQGDTGGQGVLAKMKDFLSDQIERWLSKRELRKQQQVKQAKAAGKQAKGPTGQSLVDKIANKMSKAIQSQRDNQIDKLLKLLQTDPDKALRFAIPLAAMSAFRGIGRGSNHLTEQTPDFSLPKLFGSGPVDPWQFDHKKQLELRAAYRMQAERELAAGRFRRAAYIHAHLLGDLAAAATILEQGKAYREAAVIYGERLQRPRDQARCLVLAGQSNEAAKIYEDLSEYEEAAKVWEQFADDERAKLAYKKAIAQKIERLDFLAAAKLVDEKLGDRPSAETLLWDQWPGGRDALVCAKLGFRWYSDSGKHELAREKFEKLTELAQDDHQLLLAKLSASLVQDYPDHELRETAEDRCRVVAGAGLRFVNEQEMSELLGLIRSLQSDDVLLRRDTARFESTEKSRSIPLQPVTSTGGVKLNPLPALRLLDLGEYIGGEMLDGELFALARDSRQLFGVRSASLDETQSRSVYVPLLEGDFVRFLKVNWIHKSNDRIREIILSFRGMVTEGSYARELLSTMRGRPWMIGHNPLDTPGQHEVCGGFGQDGTRWSLSYQFVLHGYSGSNLIARELLSTMLGKLTEKLDFDSAVVGGCKMIVVGNTPIIAVGDFLFKYLQRNVELLCDLTCKPNCIAASLPHTAPRIAVATDQSLQVIWLDRSDRVEKICDDETFTHVCFMHGGRLLATSEKYLYLYNLYQGSGKSVVRRDRQLLQAQKKVVALLAISAEVVGILYENGVLERYRVK